MWKRSRRLSGGGKEDAFADEALAIVRAAPQVTGAERMPDDFAILYQVGERVGRIVLHNLFHELAELDPEERRQRLRGVIGSMMGAPEIPRDWAAVQPLLRPVVRALSFLGTGDLTAAGPVWRTFAPFLAELVVIDGPTTMSYVTRGDLERWQITAAQAHGAARDNLAADTPLLCAKTPGEEGPEATWIVDSRDSYESSRLLLPGWLAGFAARVGGRPVAIVPHRGMLWVTSAESAAHLQILADAAGREFDDSPRAISPALYSVDDDGDVVAFEPAPDHPLAGVVRAGHLRLAEHEYAAQQPRLEGELEAAGTDLFVARFRVLEVEGRPRHSFCVWGHHVDSLLPHTDLVAIFDEQADEPVFVPWDAVRSRIGALWQPWDAAPARVRTQGYPTGALLRELRGHAVFLDGN
jgi:hypothetical protein